MVDHATEGGLGDIETTPGAVIAQHGKRLILTPTLPTYSEAVRVLNRYGSEIPGGCRTVMVMVSQRVGNVQEQISVHPDNFEEYPAYREAMGWMTYWIVKLGRAMIAAGESE